MRVHVVVPRHGVRANLRRRRAVVGDAAPIEHDCALEQRSERPRLVEHQHHGGTAIVCGADNVGDDRLVVCVNAGERLVHDEHIGIAHERARDQHALLLAARHAADGEVVPDPRGPWSRAPARALRGRRAEGAWRRARANPPRPLRRPKPQGHPARWCAGGRTRAARAGRDRRRRPRRRSRCCRAWGVIRPSIARTKVDLPEPLAPRMATVWPARTSRERSRKATVSPKRTVMDCADIAETGMTTRVP